MALDAKVRGNRQISVYLYTILANFGTSVLRNFSGRGDDRGDGGDGR